MPLLRKYEARYLVDVEGAFVDPDIELRQLYRRPFKAGIYTVAKLVYLSDRAK